MKRIYECLVALLMLPLVFSCSKDAFDDEFERSYVAWQNFKEESDNNYEYTTSFYSTSGWNYQTTIVVKGGQVVSRRFVVPRLAEIARPETGWTEEIAREGLKKIYFSQDFIDDYYGGNVLAMMEWTENEDDLGSHNGGSAAINLDEVYATSRTVWLKKSKEVKTFFESDNDGMISTAGYWPNGCMDDCFTGINIRSIKKL